MKKIAVFFDRGVVNWERFCDEHPNHECYMAWSLEEFAEIGRIHGAVDLISIGNTDASEAADLIDYLVAFTHDVKVIRVHFRPISENLRAHHRLKDANPNARVESRILGVNYLVDTEGCCGIST